MLCTGRCDRIAISANFGLGESVVSGAVDPDEYLLNPKAALPEIVEKKIGSKKKYTGLVQSGGTELVSGRREENGDKRPVLKPSELADQPVIWSNANFKDAVPMVLTALSCSLIRDTLEMMMSASLLAAGYRMPEGTNWVRFYKGRGYFNLSALQWGYYDGLGYLPAEINAGIGGHQPDIRVPSGNPLGGLAGIKRVWRRMHLVINVLRAQHSAEKIFKDMWDTVELWKQRNFHATNDQELISHFSETSPKLLGFASTYMVFTSLTSVSLTFLIQALDRDFPGRGALVEERKKMREELSSLEPPDVIIDDAPQPKVQAPEARRQVLAGIGVAAGRASGKARLISHPRENTRLQAGDILVAPSTDPGWTPLFLRAKAVVMEIGGYLSHGAIVAREYGIPAVVNVSGVMKALKDGEQLTVDGDEGKVYRTKQEET